MDSIIFLAISALIILNLLSIFIILRKKKTDSNLSNEQILKDEVNSLKNSFSQSFGNMSKEIAKDMTGALTRVDEKVGVFKNK